MVKAWTSVLFITFRVLFVFRLLFLIVAISLIPTILESLIRPFHQDFASLQNPRVEGQFERLKLHLYLAPKTFNRLTGFDRTAALMGSSIAAQALYELDRATESGTRKDEIRQMLRHLADTVLQPSLQYDKNVGVNQFPASGYGVYYGHVNTVLAIHRLVNGDTSHDDVIEKISKYLWIQSVNAEAGLIEPYQPQPVPAAYPADQSAVLYSLWLVEKIQAQGSKKPRFGKPADIAAKPPTAKPSRLRSKMNSATPAAPAVVVSPYQKFRQSLSISQVYRTTGLHPSGIHYSHQDIPRGVGTAYELNNLTEIDPAYSEAMFQQFRARMKIQKRVFVGFREWPEGMDRGTDADSGPVVAGIGLASSAFALSSVRFFNDFESYDGMLRLGNWLGGFWQIDSGRRYLMLDAPIRLLQVLAPGSRDSFEAFHFMAEATLLRAFTHARVDANGNLAPHFVSRIWPFFEMILFVVCILGVSLCGKARILVTELIARGPRRKDPAHGLD